MGGHTVQTLQWTCVAAIGSSLIFGVSVVPTFSAELPVRGLFGDPKQSGCQSAKAEEEGAYVSFNSGGGTGESGEGGCDFKRISKLSENEFLLEGQCFQIDGPKAKTRSTLIVLDRNHVIYGGH